MVSVYKEKSSIMFNKINKYTGVDSKAIGVINMINESINNTEINIDFDFDELINICDDLYYYASSDCLISKYSCLFRIENIKETDDNSLNIFMTVVKYLLKDDSIINNKIINDDICNYIDGFKYIFKNIKNKT